MKNTLIVLILAGVGAAIGFVTTMEIARQRQNSKRTQSPATAPVTPEQEMLQANRELAQSGEDLSDRQRYAMFGGGGGAALGFISGLLIVSRLQAKKRRATNAS